MIARIGEWVWRLAILAALAWIGWELQLLHQDMNQPVDDGSTVARSSDDTQDSLDAIHDDLQGLTQKVDAIMMVMARGR